MKFKKFCPQTIHISGCINVHICIFAIAIVLHVNIHDYCNHLYFFFFFLFFFLIFFLSLSPLLLCDPKPLPNSTQNQPNKPKSKPNQTQRKTYEKPNKKKPSICRQIYRYCRWICRCCCYRFHLTSVCEYLGLGYEREMNKIER